MGQAIKLESFSNTPIEPVPAPTVWFTAVDPGSIRVEKGVVHMDLVEERPNRDGSGVTPITVAHLKTLFDTSRENFATVMTKIMSSFRETPEGQRASMD